MGQMNKMMDGPAFNNPALGQVLTPAPGVLGVFPITVVVECICAIHLILCIIFVGTASSVSSVHVATMTITPVIQCLNAAWYLAGIPVIVLAGVGTIYRIEQLVRYYFWYLVASFLMCIVWIAFFIRRGSICHSIISTSGDVQMGANFICGLTDGFAVFWMLVLLWFLGWATYFVWSMVEYIRVRSETELLRFQEPWMAASRLIEDALGEENRLKAAAMGYPMGMMAQQQQAPPMAAGPPGYGGY